MTPEEIIDLNVFMSAVFDDSVKEAGRLGIQRVNPSFFPVVFSISSGDVRVTAIADKLMITQQAVGKTLKIMERQGLVIRGVDEKDCRAKHITLTDRGKILMDIFTKVSGNWGY